MIGTLIALAVLYGIGLVITLLASGITYSIEKDFDEEAARRAAAWLLGAPFWPFLVFRAVLKLLADAKESLKEGER